METKANKKENKGNSDDGRNGGKLITDARFASLHSDPRFREPPKHKAKVPIDSRFNRMFTDKNFSGSRAPTDKRGRRKKKKDAARNPLEHYYRLEAEEGDEKERKNLGERTLGNDEECEGEDEEGKKRISNLNSRPDEITSSEDEDENEDSSSTTSTDSDEEDVGYQEEEEEKIPEIDKETHRLAVVNLDWSQVKAVDLYVLLSSFLPKGGRIVSASVYPSEFGFKQMEEEAIHGPVGLFGDDKNKDDGDQSGDDENEDEIDNEKLRSYELSRLRFYYAVVECDSVATADYLYKNCDGLEFERSSTKLDLRFIPDSMEFKHQPRDVAKDAPVDYEGLDFHTRALQLSKIHLTWDDDEPHRAKTLKRKFNDDQLADLELQEFLASDESESSNGEDDDEMHDGSVQKQKKQDMYRALIQSGDGSDENDEEGGQDMEVTFNTGLEDLSKRILEKRDKKSETVWEAYLRKRREKKKAGKRRSKNSSEDESSDSDKAPPEQPDDFFVEEPSAKGNKVAQGTKASKKRRNEEASEEAEASRAELELLLADDKGATDSNLKGYNLKRQKIKGKKGKEIPDEAKLPSMGYDDPRFSALFASPLFALDPTDPQFKRSAAYARQMAQKQHKNETEIEEIKKKSELPRGGLMPDKTDDHNEEMRHDGLASKKEKHELSSLVKSIKMKAKQIPVHGKAPKESNNAKERRKKSKLAN